MTMMLPGSVVLARGAVEYHPQRAPANRGFGDFEVHPQRVAVEENGRAWLAHNGDWLLLFPEGLVDDAGNVLHHLAITAAAGGRETAEKLAAYRNGPFPTRVVDLAGEEHVSTHTRLSVEAEARAKGVEI